VGLKTLKIYNPPESIKETGFVTYSLPKVQPTDYTIRILLCHP